MSEKDLKLKGKVALTPGVAKGMGPAIALALAREGADVAVADHESPVMNKYEMLKELADKIKAEGRRSIPILADVTKWEDVQAMVKRTLDEFGRIDILVNVAGVTGPIETPAWEVKIEDWDNTFAVNTRGTFLCCKAVLPIMIKQVQQGMDPGCIVNIAGTSGHQGYIWRAPYSSSKWAVRGFTKTLAMEVGGYGIRVNAITPGGVMGPRMTRLIEEKGRGRGIPPDEVYKGYRGECALERFLDAEEIAAGVVWLCTDATAVTGQIIRVDCGANLGPFRREMSSVVLPGAYPWRERPYPYKWEKKEYK